MIPEAAGDPRVASTWSATSFLAIYLKDAHDAWSASSTSRASTCATSSFPGWARPRASTASGRTRRRSTRSPRSRRPATIYRYDVASGESKLWRQPKLKFDPADYETTQVFYTSKDGTRIPMFLSHKKGLKRDGSNPTLLYGYGGFNIAVTPALQARPTSPGWRWAGSTPWPTSAAAANTARTGTRPGPSSKKQNVFDDFIAAAEWLIANKVHLDTRSWRSAAGSNGGLLVGACMTQRPDLFGACLPAVGVMDMLRFHKFTIGWAWVDDYGSSDDPEQFKALVAY